MQRSGPVLRGSKYQPIATFLAARRRATVRLTFAEIETILGFSLGDYARVDASWWRAPIAAHVRSWTEIGWEARLIVHQRAVVFTRTAQQKGCAHARAEA